MRSTLPLRNVPNVTFETVSLFVGLTTACTIPTKRESQLGYKQKHMQSVYLGSKYEYIFKTITYQMFITSNQLNVHTQSKNVLLHSTSVLFTK